MPLLARLNGWIIVLLQVILQTGGMKMIGRHRREINIK